MTLHVLVTRLRDGQEYEAVVEEGDYLLISHGTHAVPDPAQLRGLGRPVTLRVKVTAP